MSDTEMTFAEKAVAATKVAASAAVVGDRYRQWQRSNRAATAEESLLRVLDPERSGTTPRLRWLDTGEAVASYGGSLFVVRRDGWRNGEGLRGWVTEVMTPCPHGRLLQQVDSAADLAAALGSDPPCRWWQIWSRAIVGVVVLALLVGAATAFSVAAPTAGITLGVLGVGVLLSERRVRNAAGFRNCRHAEPHLVEAEAEANTRRNERRQKKARRRQTQSKPNPRSQRFQPGTLGDGGLVTSPNAGLVGRPGRNRQPQKSV
jgi:hypothetical protein